MRGELKSFCIRDCEGDPADFVPEDPECFGVYVQAFIGEEGDPRSDSFDFMVCSPRWLVDNFNHPFMAADCEDWYETPNLHFGRELVLMERWDYGELWSCIQAVCVDFEGPDWRTVANRIGRWMPWEFDYRFDEALKAAGGVPKPPESE